MVKKRTKEVYMYILIGTKGFKKKLEQRFDIPNKRGYKISMRKEHFVRISNKNPIGKCMGILMHKYLKEIRENNNKT